MLDIIAAIALFAQLTIIAGVLAALAPVSSRARRAALAVSGLWVTAVVVATALGGFAPGVTGSVPGVVFPILALFGAGLGAWYLVPRFRALAAAIPLSTLVALNAGRVLGVFFVILFAMDRLPAPFAPSAGWGDIIVGTLALPLAAMAASGTARPQWIRLWNAFGMLDLIVALTLGVLSAPGTPFRVFTTGPSTGMIVTLPWIAIPALLVPLYFLIHLAIAARLRSPRRVAHAPQPA